MPAEETTLPPPQPSLVREVIYHAEALPGSTSRRELLGEFLTRPLHLVWIAGLPQGLLLWLNLRAWWFISGEVDAAQCTLAAVTLGAELCLLLGSLALAVGLRIRRQPLALAWNWPLLGAAVGYLTWATTYFWKMLPAMVPQWIVSDGEMLYYQYMLVMPLAFYAGLRLACHGIDRSIWKDIGVTVAIGAGAVLLMWLVALSLRSSSMDWMAESVITVIFAGTFIVLALLLLGAMLRLLAMAYLAVRHRGPKAMGGLILMVGIVGPLAGLALNRGIPFPADFQSWQVYALAVGTGLVLLLPNHRNPLVHRAVWLAQCAALPFSLYFFLVFLPALPLSLLAMFYLGAGVLILVPSALFIVHLQRLVDGYHCEVRDGSRWVPAALGVCAGLVMPAFYIGGALVDRVVLRGALDYAYAPNYHANGPGFSGSPATVRRSLEHLRDFKAGLDLPFLTDLYKGIVFGGLVLPEEKMQHVHQVFLGGELPGAKESFSAFFGHGSMVGGRRQTGPEQAPRLMTPPRTDSVALANVEQTFTEEGPCERAHLTLTMENSASEVAEFVTQLHLPEAARVTGFWLHVGPTRVPGKLVERKTALWVYHRIRDAEVPRDPGLLSYTGPETVELRVYPFASHERRTAEIELLYPAALGASIKVGDHALTAARAQNSGNSTSVLTPAGDAGALAVLSPETTAQFPTVVRQPYIHFLLDRSANSDVDAATLKRALDVATTRFPAAKEAVLTTVNYECQEPFSAEPKPLADLRTALNDEAAFTRRLPPLQGGFLQERALRRGWLGARDRLAQARDGNDPALSRYPVFVVVAGSHTQPVDDGDETGGPGSGGLASFAALVPETGNYFTVTGGGRTLKEVTIGNSPNGKSGRLGEALDNATNRTVLLRCGGETVACPADVSRPQTVRFSSPGAAKAAAADQGGNGLSVFDPSTHTFQAVAAPQVTRVAPGAAYARASEVYEHYRALIENPADGNVGLTRLTALSRERGVLTGATSYIVVENSAQWKILEQKEKQKLANSAALEIEQSPEPGTWVMIILGVAGVIVLTRRRRVAAMK